MPGRTTVDAYYRLLAARDRSGLLALLSKDIKVAYHGPQNLLPWIGEFPGHAGFEEFFAIIAAHVDIVSMERLSLIADDSKVAVQCLGTWRIKTTGKEVNGHMVNIFGVDGEKITSYEVYADTAAFAAGMRGNA
ncbi:MAG: nuclear transport factor 2 family protein [Gammaproteobacteria bacterium]|nr:nuclear transport factor 2 family protein [Gammaproteobacteria bacterium]